MKADEAERLVSHNRRRLEEAHAFLDAADADWLEYGRTGRVLVEVSYKAGRVERVRRCGDENS